MRLIDANHVANKIHKNFKYAKNDIEAGAFLAALYIIDCTPTIEAEPVKHGQWDTHDVVKILASGRTLDGFCQCEACGSIFPFNFSEYSFCPECGARMDGDKT